MSYALLFPGQGSQSVGMLGPLSAEFPQVRSTFEEASGAVGYDLWQLAEEGPPEALQEAEKVQPALVAADVAVWRAWQSLGTPAPKAAAGHSLGEYAALVCAGVMGFADALQLVALRGRLMKEAAGEKGGGMAAILGMPDDAVDRLCAAAPAGEMCEAANLNAPGQVVIAASRPALAWLKDNAAQFGARRVVELAMSVPSHCSIMKPAARALGERLATIPLHAASFPVLHNVDTLPRTAATEVREALSSQLYHPVRWAETIARLVADGVDAFLECGPGRVLSGLQRRNARSAQSYALEDPEQLRKAAAALG